MSVSGPLPVPSPPSAPDVEGLYPLTPMQQGMLVHALIAPRSSLYLQQLSWSLRGPLDAARLRAAWTGLLERHPVLRSSFLWRDLKEPVQVVHREVSLPWREDDWRDRSPARQRSDLDALLAEQRERGFDWSQAPLLRLWLIRLEDRLHELVWSYSHLLLDGWSMARAVGEVFADYHALGAGDATDRPRPRPYGDYVAWLRSRDAASSEPFWRRWLHGFTAATAFGVDRGSAASLAEDGHYGEVRMQLSAGRTEALQGFARRHRLTLSTIVQGGWGLLLSRYGAGEDVVFGTVVAGRPAEIEGVDSMLGLFINTLPMRVRVRREARVLDWLRDLQDGFLELRGHEHTPLVDVQRWSELPAGSPLFDSIFAFENYSLQAAGGDPALVVKNSSLFERTNFPLTASAGVVGTPTGPRLFLKLAFREERFEGRAMERALGHLAALVEDLAGGDGERRLGAVEMLGADERRALTRDRETTRRAQGAYAERGSVDERILAAARRWPDEVAVEDRGRTLTYRQLERRSAALAARLRRLGVGVEDRVGVVLERSAELVLALLAVWRAGAAYVAVDPAWPRARGATVLADAGVAAVLVAPGAASAWRGRSAVVEVGAGTETEDAGPAPPLAAPAVGEERLAYVVYTSGSTGAPKGVMVTHRSLGNYLSWCVEAYRIPRGGVVPLHTSVAVDLTVTSLFAPLLAGARTVVLAAADGAAGLLEAWRARGSFSLVKTTPAHLELLDRSTGDGRPPGEAAVLVLGGEALRGETLRPWRRHSPATRLINEYGPTEAAVGCCVHEVGAGDDPSGPVPIGTAIGNVQMYVLDRELRPVPQGVVGELHIGGTSLARGYLGRPARTALAWLPDPFAGDGGRLYRTGDLGRWSEEGRIEYLGRSDRQVKVRGHRVELGEVESVLASLSGVAEAVVELREVGGEPELVAWYVAAASGPAGTDELREALRASLPAAMVPARFVALAEMPLTAAGKLDRRRLPPPEPLLAGAAGRGAAPDGELERQVAAAWREVLGVEPGAEDNFFDLGGHSILLLRVHGKLEKALGRPIPLVDLFRHPTVAALARRLGTVGDGGDSLSEVEERAARQRRAVAQQHAAVMGGRP